MSKSIENPVVCDHFWYIFNLKSIDFELFIFFLAAGIDFVATIWIRTTNSHRKSRLKDDSNPISNEIWLEVDLIALAKRIGFKWPSLLMLQFNLAVSSEHRLARFTL